MSAHMQWWQPGQEPPKLSQLWEDPSKGRGRPMKLSVTLAEDSQYGRAGQLVALDLTPGDVHVSEEIPSYLAGYAVEGMIADQLSPALPVDFSFGEFRSMSRDNAFLRVKVKTHHRAKVNEIDPETEMTPFVCIERAIGSFLDHFTTPQASYDVRAAAAARCMQALLLDREIDVRDLLTTTANWATGFHVTLGATAKWNAGSTSDPIADLKARIHASNQRIAKIAMARHVSSAFLDNPKVRDYCMSKLGSKGLEQLVDDEDSEVYKLPGLPPIVVADCKHTDTAGVSPDYTWGNDVVLVTVPKTVPTHGEAIATTYTRRYKGPNGTGIVTREFPVEDRGSRGGTFLVVAMAEIAQFTSNTCGGVIKDAYQ